MNILLLGVNGDIGKSILEKIYSKENNYFLTFSKKKPDLRKKNLRYIRIDFSKKNNVKKQINFLNKFNFDIIINNVGDSNPYKKFTNLSDEDIYQSFNINFFSPFKVIFSILKKNIKLKKKLNIISISSNTIKYLGSEKNFPYFISKSTLETSLKFISNKFSKNKIRINIIRPGLIKVKKTTKLLGYSEKNFKKRQTLIPIGRAGKPEDISNLIKFLSDEKSEYIFGQVISVSGGE